MEYWRWSAGSRCTYVAVFSTCGAWSTSMLPPTFDTLKTLIWEPRMELWSSQLWCVLLLLVCPLELSLSSDLDLQGSSATAVVQAQLLVYLFHRSHNISGSLCSCTASHSVCLRELSITSLSTWVISTSPRRKESCRALSSAVTGYLLFSSV